MRRLIFLVALLGRFAGQEYVWRARPLRRPVPIEQPLSLDPTSGTQLPWWQAGRR